MEVYINMEMPQSCGVCKFFAWKRGVGQHCAVDDRITFHATIDGMDVAYERNGNCPLVEIPPHGRLIDADAVEKQIEYVANLDWNKKVGASGGMLAALEIVEDAPTILEAEEATDGEQS